MIHSRECEFHTTMGDYSINVCMSCLKGQFTQSGQKIITQMGIKCLDLNGNHSFMGRKLQCTRHKLFYFDSCIFLVLISIERTDWSIRCMDHEHLVVKKKKSVNQYNYHGVEFTSNNKMEFWNETK